MFSNYYQSAFKQEAAHGQINAQKAFLISKNAFVLFLKNNHLYTAPVKEALERVNDYYIQHSNVENFTAAVSNFVDSVEKTQESANDTDISEALLLQMFQFHFSFFEKPSYYDLPSIPEEGKKTWHAEITKQKSYLALALISHTDILEDQAAMLADVLAGRAITDSTNKAQVYSFSKKVETYIGNLSDTSQQIMQDALAQGGTVEYCTDITKRICSNYAKELVGQVFNPRTFLRQASWTEAVEQRGSGTYVSFGA